MRRGLHALAVQYSFIQIANSLDHYVDRKFALHAASRRFAVCASELRVGEESIDGGCEGVGVGWLDGNSSDPIARCERNAGGEICVDDRLAAGHRLELNYSEGFTSRDRRQHEQIGRVIVRHDFARLHLAEEFDPVGDPETVRQVLQRMKERAVTDQQQGRIRAGPRRA